MKIVASFAPDSEFTRHSEGSFLRLNDGRIMFIYSRFTGHNGDDAPSNLVAVYSANEGETWSAPQIVIPASMYNTKNVMSVSLMRMANGDIGLFYIVKQTPSVSRIMLSRSNDEGENFYSHTECTSPECPGYYVLNNDRVIRLNSGRILVPLAFHRSGIKADGKTPFFDGRSFNCFLYSDDDGFTWNEAPGTIYPPFTNTSTGLQEPGLVEKLNGVVWSYMRTDKMYQYESLSTDFGMSWTIAQPSRFTSPTSPMLIKRNPYTNELYAVWNPIPMYNGRESSRAGWGRTPLVYAVSKDDGITWSDQVIIEDAPDHGYCYPAIFFTDADHMLLSYCSGGPEDGICLAKTSIMKITL